MIKQVFCFLLVLTGTVRFSQAQSAGDTLLMVPSRGGAYFYHVVASKETIYGLAREFGLEPGVLASFNHLTLKSPLKLYQLVKVPLTAANLDQASAHPPGGAVPLYHKVTSGETLYHITQLQGKVPVGLVKGWNHLQGNSVRSGELLVVGWLKKTGASAPAEAAAPAAAPTPETAAVSPERSVPAPEAAAPKAAATPAPAVSSTAAAIPASSGNDAFLDEVIASENASRQHKTSAPTGSDNAFSVSRPAPAKKTASPPAETTATAPSVAPATAPASASPFPEASGPAPVKQEAASAPAADTPSVPEKPSQPDSFEIMLNRVTHTPRPGGNPAANNAAHAAPETTKTADVTAPVSGQSAITDSPAAAAAPDASPATVKSEFQSDFDRQTAGGANVTVKKGAAGWFKSNVKPGSGRYYALCNDLPRGTIVRVINPINQKSVLVKVLDVIPSQKENYNLIIKLSDAAMGDLDVAQSRFWCEIDYPAGKP